MPMKLSQDHSRRAAMELWPNRDAYLQAVQEIGDTYFHGVTRFTTSAFMRSNLGAALESRGVAPHIYESEDEAAGVAPTTMSRQE